MMRFNHVAVRVDGRHSDTVAAMLTEKLGFVQLRRTERSAWFRQPGTNVDLQLSRSDTAHRDPRQAALAGVVPERYAAG